MGNNVESRMVDTLWKSELDDSKKRYVYHKLTKSKEHNPVFFKKKLDAPKLSELVPIKKNSKSESQRLLSSSSSSTKIVQWTRTGNFYLMHKIDDGRISTEEEAQFWTLKANPHPNLVNVKWILCTPEGYSVLYDHCPELKKVVLPIRKVKRNKNVAKTEAILRRYAAEIVLALEHLHKHGFTYKNISIESLRLTHSDRIKLLPYELCNGGNQHRQQQQQHLPPELYYHNSTKCLGPAVDWWSFGIVLYQLAVGSLPVVPKKQSSTSTVPGRHRPLLPFPSNLSLPLLDLLRSLLILDPDLRLGSRRGSVEIKHHKFFNNFDWEDLMQEQREEEAEHEISKPAMLVQLDGEVVQFETTSSGNDNSKKQEDIVLLSPTINDRLLNKQDL